MRGIEMTRSRLGLLGLCVVVLGTMAFSAGSAQAEFGAQWLFAEKAPNSGLVAFLEAFVGLESETVIVLHTKIAGINVLFECKSLAAVNMKLKASGSIGEGAKIKFSECITKLNGATSAPCVPKAGGTETGVINTNALHALMRLHELAGGVRDDIILVLPDSGETIAMMEFSAECAIGTKVPLIGTFTLKDCENLILTHLVKHLLEFGPLDGLWVISKTAEHVTTVLGSWWARLVGAHEGLKWSGDPF
jgi:hypothetical protein